MYAQTMVTTGSIGHLDSSSLNIRKGSHTGCPYFAIVSTADNLTILRGKSRNTSNGAMESFIDTVLLTGERFRGTIARQRQEWLDGLERDEEGDGTGSN
jgi:hypothetical protein